MIENKSFLDLLKEKILVCDGAMGTMLHKEKGPGCPDLFNIDSKAIKKVIDIHLKYIEAGSDIIQTNTFGSNPSKLEGYGFIDKIEEINKNAVLAVKKAINIYKQKTSSNKKILIAGDIGPTGKLLEPAGTLKHNEAVDIFLRQIELLLKSDVDIILIETIMDLNEALAAVEAAKKLSDDIPLACTLTFGENGITLMGNKAENVVKTLTQAGCDIVGANCSIGSDKMVEIVKKMREKNPQSRLMFQPNAGLPVLKDGKTYYNETPEIMAKNIKKFLPYNPSILGACCGSTPLHIKKIAELIKPP